MNKVNVTAGLRVGFWRPGRWGETPFQCVGHYSGNPLGNRIPGETFSQELMEGTLKFKVGVLFRPDLGRKQRLETILIIEQFIPEMFEYEDWDSAAG